MKKFLAKIWKSNVSIFYLMLFVALMFSGFVDFRFSSSNVGDVFSSLGLSFTAGMYWTIFTLSPLISLFFVSVLLRIYWWFFGFIYARSFSGKLVTVNELPIGRVTFQKFVLLVATVTNVVVGMIRLFIFIDYNAYFLINYVVKPIISLSIAIGAYFIMKKYMLEGKVAYNTFMSLSIPYLFYFFLFV